MARIYWVETEAWRKFELRQEIPNAVKVKSPDGSESPNWCVIGILTRISGSSWLEYELYTTFQIRGRVMIRQNEDGSATSDMEKAQVFLRSIFDRASELLKSTARELQEVEPCKPGQSGKSSG